MEISLEEFYPHEGKEEDDEESEQTQVQQWLQRLRQGL